MKKAFCIVVIPTLLSCAPAPSELALQMCIAVPALTLDSAGQQLVRDIATVAELQAWHDLPFSPGMERLSTPSFGVVRTNSSCEITSVTEMDNGVSVELIRDEPDITTLRVFDNREVEGLEARLSSRLTLLVIEQDDGMRVESSSARAREEAAAARLLEGVEREAAFEALYQWFPDPTINVELDRVEIPPSKF
jgi:hypothetical protein